MHFGDRVCDRRRNLRAEQPVFLPSRVSLAKRRFQASLTPMFAAWFVHKLARFRDLQMHMNHRAPETRGGGVRGLSRKLREICSIRSRKRARRSTSPLLLSSLRPLRP